MHILPRSFTRTLPARSAKGKLTVLLVLAAAALIAAVISLCSGSQSLSLGQLWQVLCTGDTDSTTWRIFVYVRLPRTLACMLAGLALAVAGALIQGVLNNAMASPNVIGVNSGAGFFAIAAATLLPGVPGIMAVAAFLGALLTTLFIYSLAAKAGLSRVTLVLAGIAVSGILSAGIDTITLLYPDQVVGATGFMTGSFSGVALTSLWPAAAYIGAGFVLALFLAADLDLLQLGEETASSLGMRVGLVRFLCILASSLLAGAAVSFAGLLGFVGLLVPHAARRLVGGGNRFLLPASALLGMAFVLGCDSLGRVLFAPFELPVGILMSFLGGPFFLFLLLRQKRSRVYD